MELEVGLLVELVVMAVSGCILIYYIPRKAFHSVCIATNIEYFRY